MTQEKPTEYQTLAQRLQRSPLYQRLGCTHAVSRMLMQRVYDLWVNRPETPPKGEKNDAQDV